VWIEILWERHQPQNSEPIDCQLWSLVWFIGYLKTYHSIIGLSLTKMWPSLNYGCGLNGNKVGKLQEDCGEVNKPTSRLWAMAPVTPPNQAPLRENALTQRRTPACWAYGAKKPFCWALSIKATVSETGGVVLCSVDVDVLRFCVFRPARREKNKKCE